MTPSQKTAFVYRSFSSRLNELMVDDQMRKHAFAAAGRNILQSGGRMAGRMAGRVGAGLASRGTAAMGDIGRGAAGMNDGFMRNMLMGKAPQVLQGLMMPGGGNVGGHTFMVPGTGHLTQNMAQNIGQNVTKRLGTGAGIAGGAYLLDQNGQRRGRNTMAEHYNEMGYLPKLLAAAMNRQVPTQSFFNPSWALPYM